MMETIRMVADYIRLSSELVFYTLFARNPCKKCLVQACCSQYCDPKLQYLRYCDRDGHIGFLKLSAISIIVACISVILSVIHIAFIAP